MADILAASALGLFFISVGASAVGGALGMASGIFIVPVLTTIEGLDIHVAIGAGIVSVIACSCGSAASFLRERLTNVRLAIVLETATTLGAASGVLLSGVVPVSALYAIFAAVLLLSAWQMLMRRHVAVVPVDGKPSQGWARRLDAVYPDRVLGRDVTYRVDRLPAGLGLMYGAGLLSALLGIGSGVLKIPAMDTALRLPIKVSSGSHGSFSIVILILLLSLRLSSSSRSHRRCSEQVPLDRTEPASNRCDTAHGLPSLLCHNGNLLPPSATEALGLEPERSSDHAGRDRVRPTGGAEDPVGGLYRRSRIAGGNSAL